MPDDKSRRDFRDRDRVSGDEEYEVGDLASEFQLTGGAYSALREPQGRQTQPGEVGAHSSPFIYNISGG